eukprot:jgi/Psemu1/65079/estExt_Genemark1.C_1010065
MSVAFVYQTKNDHKKIEREDDEKLSDELPPGEDMTNTTKRLNDRVYQENSRRTKGSENTRKELFNCFLDSNNEGSTIDSNEDRV